ncbi:helix-turn-helix domain-containing protein [Dethiothermospora halolimnae]|uniref:helix-turn-helix domain-containing protein n=1 Tax=Dethiothermospora halolimnae TaxID=3114390 RepID=UPI003CCBE057
MEQNELTLGEKIKIERKKRGFTQKDLAGDFITRTMLSKIENNFARPSIKTIEYIASKLDLPVTYFLESMVNGDMNSKSNMENVFEHSCFLIKNKEYDKAIIYIDEMLENNGHESKDIYYLRSIYNLIICYFKLDKIEECEKRALSIIPSLKDKKDFYYLSKTYKITGSLYFENNEYKVAEKNFREGLKFLKDSYVDDILQEQVLYYNIALCLYKQKRFDEAIDNLAIVQKISHEYACYKNPHYVNMLLGNIEMARDNITASIKYTCRAIYYFENKGDKYYTALCNKNLGIGYIISKDYDKAFKHLSQSLKYFQSNDIKDLKRLNEIKLDIVLALSKKGEYEEAYRYIKDIDINYLSEKCKCDYYISLARYHIHIKDLDQAEDYLNKAKGLTDDKYILQDWYTVTANLYSLKDDYKKAYELSEEARKVLNY